MTSVPLDRPVLALYCRTCLTAWEQATLPGRCPSCGGPTVVPLTAPVRLR